MSDRFRLSCGHVVDADVKTNARLADGWHAAIYCGTCRRRREVSWVGFGVPIKTATSGGARILLESDERRNP